jgi:hypothetical protein
MRLSNLSQSIAVKLLSIDERVRNLASQADKLDAAVEQARAIISNRIEVDAAKYEQVRSGFPTLHAQAQAARQRADSERGILQEGIRSWLEALPHNSKLHPVSPPSADSDLATLDAKLQGMRAELARLNAVTIPADDIAGKAKAYVDELKTRAAPMLRGVGNGQDLTVAWPDGRPDANPNNGSGYSSDANALLLFALLMPNELAETIVRAAQDTLPTKLEKRLSELPDAIDALSYEVAFLREKAGMPPDPAMRPWHHLSVRLSKDEPNVTAAMAHVIADRIRA